VLKLRAPHPLVVLLGGVGLAAASTWLLPAGAYERQVDAATGIARVVPGTYALMDPAPVGVFDALVAVPRGFVNGADVILTILVVGGAFALLDASGALSRLIGAFVGRTRRPAVAIVGLGVVFAAFGAAEQMHEEFIALMPVLVVLSRNLGFGAVTALAMSMGAAMVGAAFGPTNPFGTGAALKAAELAPMSAAGTRVAVLAVALAAWLAYTLWRAPSDDVRPDVTAPSTAPPTLGDALSLLALTLPIVAYVVGVLRWGWGINELTALVLLGGFIVGALQRYSLTETAARLIAGMEGMVGAAILVGVARGIALVLTDGRVIDTVIAGIVAPLQLVPPDVAAVAMIPAHTLIHIAVPSTSGQAMLTMPIFAPLGDLLGISRDAVVLAFSAGGVFADAVNPTNGGLLAMLLNAKVSYGRWLKFAIPGMLLVWAVAAVGIVLLG
jgi:uncharacterized ion transporter superfamily protein YfcC